MTASRHPHADRQAPPSSAADVRRQRPRTAPAPDAVKGAVAGLVGGLVGTWFMTEYQSLWSRVVDGAEPQSAAGKHDARDWQEKNEDANANEHAAQAAARHTVGRRLSDRELAVAAPLVHYGFGAGVSTAYGALVEYAPAVGAGAGSVYGTMVWIGGDELAVPALGWSHPEGYPLDAHLQSLTAHLVFGVVTELTRRLVRRALR